ncbi:MAG: SUMF1/EgtB/PvdO family nonheme iron enzyme [Planctomycetes bacterium]|nr:SUMF1/EgtB/PvdO family nonheme iron enzyme [Planctomycetota bacterium]
MNAELLLETLLSAQATAWQSEQRLPVEVLLQQHGVTGADQELLLALIEGEILLREDRGEPRAAAIQDFVGRFPELEVEICRLKVRTEFRPVPARVRAALPKTPAAIGRYRVERLLGQGSFGLVYLAHDEQLQREVAIKIPHADRVACADEVSAYLSEARLAANLSHPHIVPVYDVGSSSEFPCYVVSKFIDGNSLSEKLERWRPSHRETAQLLAAIAEALEFAHGQRIIHRDVKPANILLDRDGEPYLADFGLAMREHRPDEFFSRAGTPAYMSPEQVRGEGHLLDNRSDLFSLGVMFYEMLVGRRPFVAQDPAQLRARILTADPVPPRQIDDRIPLALEQICLRALAKRRADRYASAFEMAHDLRGYLADAVASPRDQVPAGQVPTNPATPGASDGTREAKLRLVPKGLRAFDEHDADFFLELLPGPRDRHGLPDSLRFWKSRIEDRDPSRTFPVGLIYGPSGSGKSSLVRAGLFPRLSRDILCVYVAATPADTESRLLSGLERSGALQGAGYQNLPSAVAALRLNGGDPSGRKVLIVIDQIEQWLHARGDSADHELVEALRQCDGVHVQGVCLVRDDFWLGVTRFFQELEVNLVQGHNAMVVDLFDVSHSRRILAAFGRAFGQLPDQIGAMTREQHDFLDGAVAGLAADGKVVGAHLALFAEMMKSRPWTPASLKQAGGTSGVGETFLEMTFAPPTANPRHRFHQATARAVLGALLPDEVTDIRGHMRTLDELRQAVGPKVSAADFEDVIQLLDGEVRLITPTESLVAADTAPTGEELAPQRGYQLTHDYLVQPLRNWLTRKQQETRQGRAELQLAERSRLWQWRKNIRFLPTLLEYLNFRWCTEPRRWNTAERGLMQQAGRRHFLRAAAGLSLFSATAAAGVSYRDQLAARAAEDAKARANAAAEEAQARANAAAAAFVDKLLLAPTTKVPNLLARMDVHRPQVEPMLWNKFVRPDGSESDELQTKLHAALALMEVEEYAKKVVKYLGEQLTRVDATQFSIVRDALLPHAETILGPLKELAQTKMEGEDSESFRAACALATYAPHAEIWKSIGGEVADVLVKAKSRETWLASLEPVSESLLKRLQEVFRDPEAQKDGRNLEATKSLVVLLKNRVQDLARLLADSKPVQFHLIFDQIKRTDPDQFVEWAEQADESEIVWEQWANVAVALLKLGRPQKAWPVFAKRPNNEVRSQLIHLVHPLKVDPFQLIEGYDKTDDNSIKAALLQALGEYPLDELYTAQSSKTEDFLKKVLEEFQTNSDASIHSSAEWLWNKWFKGDTSSKLPLAWQIQWKNRLAEIKYGLKEKKVDFDRYQKNSPRNWFVNNFGQTYVILDLETKPAGPNRLFAIATTEITRKRYKQWKDKVNKNQPEVVIHSENGQESRGKAEFQFPEDQANCMRRGGDSALVGISWHEAARFCNWLSAEYGFKNMDDWCYVDHGGYMTLADNYLERPGFRLPTTEEWEFACRAGTNTSRYYGESTSLLPHYAFYLGGDNNSEGDVVDFVGRRKPNDFGLFDMLGNAFEWCNDLSSIAGQPVPENPNSDDPAAPRGNLGGGYSSPPGFCHVGAIQNIHSTLRNMHAGFRPVRTLPDHTRKPD